MRKTLEIALNDLRLIFMDRSIWINLVLIPIALSFALSLASSGGETEMRLPVDVIDLDGSDLSAQFLTSLRSANPNLLLCPMDNTADDVCGLEDAALDDALATERLENQTSLAFIQLPAGFAEQVTTGEAVTVIYRSNEDAAAPSFILQSVQAASQQLGGALVAADVGAPIIDDFVRATNPDAPSAREAIFSRAQALWAANPVTVESVTAAATEVGTNGSDTRTGFGQSIPGMASMYVMFAVLPVISVFIRERRNWTMQRLQMMPVSRAQILGGKLLARFLLGMIQFGIMFGFGLVMGARFGSDPLGLVLVMVAFTLCITALAVTMMTLIRTDEQAQGIVLFMTLTLAPLGGAWWPLDIVGDTMRAVGHISPIAWAMDGFRSLIFFGGNWLTVLPMVGVLLAATVVLFLFGVTRYQYE